MKKVLFFVFSLLISAAGSYAYVVICPHDGQSGARDGCLRITRVNIDGEWVEANCDNVNAPDGWFKYDCL